MTNHSSAAKSLPSITDKQCLMAKSYKTQDKLNVRILTHQLYTQPQVDFIEWVLDKIEWRGNETAVDLGCGAGTYVEQGLARSATYIAGDLSFGMVQELSHPNLPRLNLDIQHIPLADNTADVVLANHMLYHVPDKDAALAEIKRILRPNGHLIAATNSATNMIELINLRRQALQHLGLPLDPILEKSPVAELFSLENGRSHLQPHFTHIQRHDLPSALVFPNPQPILNYITSSRDWYETLLPKSITWDDLYHQFQTLLTDHFAQHPEFRISKLSGVFICRP